MKKVEKYPNLEGKKASLFCLPNQKEEKVCLKDLLDQEKNILLFFYPKDMTPGCTTEAISFSENFRKLKNQNLIIYGISKLDSKSKQKFIDKNNLKINLLSDEYLKICDKYGVWRDKNMYGKMVKGIARETFLIDGENGKIIKHWQKVKPAEHVLEVLKFVKELNKKKNEKRK